jgi:catechol 2,3-dioxygenase-like lactoylglutathione lyase family enzyme
MSRLHVHLHVRDFEQSIRFYTTLFNTEPARREAGYAKWMLDDPKVNFAISVGGETPGVGHLGIQVDSAEELAVVSARAQEAAGAILVERGARCCYATGDKAWAEDPQGVRWETFHTTGTLDEAGHGAEESFVANANGAREVESAACCCTAGKNINEASPANCCSA